MALRARARERVTRCGVTGERDAALKRTRTRTTTGRCRACAAHRLTAKLMEHAQNDYRTINPRLFLAS